MSAPARAFVEADDPLSGAGLGAMLTGTPGLRLVERPADADAGVLVVEDGGEGLLVRVKALRVDHDLGVVVVAAQVDEADMVRLVRAGVSALLLRREATQTRVRRATLAAAAGESSLSPSMVGRLMLALEQGADADGARAGREGLSDREAEVVALLADGLDTEQVAHKLSYSPRTIKNIVHDLTVRLALRNRTHLVAESIRRGWI